MSLTLEHYLLLSAALFTIGAVGLVTRRNVIVLFMCVEIMLNAANLALIAFSRFHLVADGQMFAVTVMAVAAAEAGIGLAIMVNIFRHKKSLLVDDLNVFKN